MVARTKVYTGESPVEEIQQAFKEEMAEIMKDAALKLGCSVDELKYRFDNLGRVEVVRMTPEEMSEFELKRFCENKRKTIRRVKGLDNG